MMIQSEFLANSRNLLKAREKSRVLGELGFVLLLIVSKTSRDF